MLVRTIKQNDLAKFAQLSPSPANLQSKLQTLWIDQRSSPEYCFVAEEDSNFVGGAVYLLFPSLPEEVALWDLLLPTTAGSREIGSRILIASFNALGRHSVKHIEARIESTDDNAIIRRACLEAAGMCCFQEKWRFDFSSHHALPEIGGTLIYQSLLQLSNDFFITLIENVTTNTLDRGDLMNMKNLGTYRAAESYFNILKDLDYRPELWQIGIAPDNIPVGLVVPQIFSPKLGAINYLGVVPQERGKGYGLELLHKGTEILLTAGSEQIIGDIDTLNFPLAQSLETLGYKKKCEISCYEFRLA